MYVKKTQITFEFLTNTRVYSSFIIMYYTYIADSPCYCALFTCGRCLVGLAFYA